MADDVPLDADGLARPSVFPRRLPTPSRARLSRRASQIFRVGTRNFAPLIWKTARHRRVPDDEFAAPLRHTFEELGGTFMKFGQLVGSAPSMFGEAVAQEFRSCLDTGAPVPIDRIRTVVEESLGGPMEATFAAFEEEPIGRASMAVVHRARLHDGHEVAVKVLRPGIELQVATDLDLFEPLLKMAARHTGDANAGSLLQMFDGFRIQIGEELDLRNELRAMDNYRRLLDQVDLPLVMVPRPHAELSGMKVLVMEFLDGVPVDDLDRIAEYGYDPVPVVDQLVKGFLMTALRWGTFHGDLHAGNLLLMPDGRVGVIDWGIVGRLDRDSYFFFRRLCEAALGDDTAWKDIADLIIENYGQVIREGPKMNDEEITTFVRATIEPVVTAPFGQVSLSALVNAPMEQVATARGMELSDRSARGLFRRLREQRKLRGMAESHGGINSDFDRGTFLLGKQLMYFERYGKMYLADKGIFSDRSFFERALADSPALAGRNASDTD